MNERTKKAINRYIAALDEGSLRFALFQLLAYPESRQHIAAAIKEYDKFYNFHLEVEKCEQKKTQ